MLRCERIEPQERFAKLHPPGTEFAGYVVRIREDVPETLAPIAGDVIHNLRSALDIMMCELVRSADEIKAIIPPHEIEGVRFPFCKSDDKLDEEAKNSGVIGAGQTVLELVNAWQPFQNGAAGLYELHRLDIVDKHRSIIPTMVGAEFSLPSLLTSDLADGTPVFDPNPERCRVREGQIITVWSTSQIQTPLGTQMPCLTKLALVGEHLNGRDLLETLRHLIDVVDAVLTSFETETPPDFVPAPTPDPTPIPPGSWVAVRGGPQ